MTLLTLQSSAGNAPLMSPKRFEELLDKAEDAEDYKALAEHASDPDPDLVPWDEVKRDLGLIE